MYFVYFPWTERPVRTICPTLSDLLHLVGLLWRLQTEDTRRPWKLHQEHHHNPFAIQFNIIYCGL